MAPKKVAVVESSTSPAKDPEKEAEGQKTGPKADGREEPRKAVRKVSPHPSTMDMVKMALMELDQRKGVSAQAIRTFIKEKYETVDNTRLKMMVRKALIKGMESGAFVRPANSSNTTGAQGRFRLAVRKPKPAKSKEAKENMNPNTVKAKEAKAKSGDVKTKKTQSAAVQGDKPKKTQKNDALVSKVPPSKKPKAKRAAEAPKDELEPKPQKPSKALKAENGQKPGAKKGGRKRPLKAEEPSGEGAEAGLPKVVRKQAQKPKGGSDSEVTVQKKRGKKVDDGEQSSRSLGKKGKKAVEK